MCKIYDRVVNILFTIGDDVISKCSCTLDVNLSIALQNRPESTRTRTYVHEDVRLTCTCTCTWFKFMVNFCTQVYFKHYKIEILVYGIIILHPFKFLTKLSFYVKKKMKSTFFSVSEFSFSVK